MNTGWLILGPASRPPFVRAYNHVRVRCLGCGREFVRQLRNVTRGQKGCKDCARVGIKLKGSFG